MIVAAVYPMLITYIEIAMVSKGLIESDRQRRRLCEPDKGRGCRYSYRNRKHRGRLHLRQRKNGKEPEQKINQNAVSTRRFFFWIAYFYAITVRFAPLVRDRFFVSAYYDNGERSPRKTKREEIMNLKGKKGVDISSLNGNVSTLRLRLRPRCPGRQSV